MKKVIDILLLITLSFSIVNMIMIFIREVKLRKTTNLMIKSIQKNLDKIGERTAKEIADMEEKEEGERIIEMSISDQIDEIMKEKKKEIVKEKVETKKPVRKTTTKRTTKNKE